MITIQSKKEGFRRCGIAHSRTPASHPDDRFSLEELKILQAEPMLVVTVVQDVDPEAEAEAKAKAEAEAEAKANAEAEAKGKDAAAAKGKGKK